MLRWSLLAGSIYFFAASTDPVGQRSLVKAALISGTVAVAGLAIVNLSTDFHALSSGASLHVFWIETCLLLGYLIWLAVLYSRSKRGSTSQVDLNHGRQTD